MIKERIKKIDIDDNIYVDELFVFTNEENKYSYLLGKNGCAMIVDEYLLNSLKNKDISENFKFKLLGHGLGGLKEPEIKPIQVEDNNIYFVIDVTKRCNFDCLYCFRNLKDNRIIDDDKLEDICNYILNIVKERKLKKVKVQVWGGEPLLAFNKLEYIYNFFKDTPVNLAIDVETNGSLVTDALAKRLYEMRVNIGISIDGMIEHQDKQRRLANGKSSNELVKKGIKNLQKYYKEQLGGIAVVTKYNYKDVFDIIKYFAKDLKITSIKFNIVRDNPNANQDNIGLSTSEVKWFANALFDAVKKYNIEFGKFEEGNIVSRINNLNERINNNYCNSKGCRGGINLISIDMLGNIYPCEMMDYKDVLLSSIYKDGKLSTNKDLIKDIKKAKKENKYFKDKTIDECNDCPWKYYCEGGCRSRIVYSDGKMKYDEIECVFNKVIYERIIKDILENIKE